MKKKEDAHLGYIFAENDFDRLEELARQAKKAAEEAAKAPSYNQKELDEAKAESFEKGKNEGIRETLANQEERIANALDTLISKFDSLASRQTAFEALQQHETVIMAINIAKRFVPHLLDKQKEEEIFKLLRNCLIEHTKEPRILIRLSPQVEADISDRVLPLVAELGFEGKIDIVADLDMPAHDCVIEWSEGGTERIAHRLWTDIEEEIKQFLNTGTIPDLALETAQNQDTTPDTMTDTDNINKGDTDHE